MDQFVTTDARRDSFNFHSALKSIHDQLVIRDVNAMKFLCKEFIPLQKMEKIRTALDLFKELETRRKICPPDNLRLVAELLYCLRQYRLCEKLPYNGIVGQIVEGGKSQLHPCRILLHRICEEIAEENFKTLRYLCTDISKSSMEKIRDPHDLIIALERLGLIVVTEGNLSYLRRLLNDTNLEALVARIDRFRNGCVTAQLSQGTTIAGGSKGDVTRKPDITLQETHQLSNSSNTVANLCASMQSSSIFPPEQDHQRVTPPSDHQCFVAVPKVLSEGCKLPGAHEGQLKISVSETERLGSNKRIKVQQDKNVLPSYSMTHHPRGICLIINNIHFHKDVDDPNSQQQKVRTGSEIDCSLLENVFGQKLDFKVEVCNDLNDAEICKELEDVASRDHTNYDCFVCCVLSHGVNGAIYGANGKLVEIKQITSCFRPSRCRSLCGKPKLFFVQACQGKEKQFGSDVVTDGPTTAEGCGATLEAENVPDEADFLVALATVPGYVSYRSKSKGSWYITTLVKKLEMYADCDDLLSILTCVNDEICRAGESTEPGSVCKQVAMPMTTLRKKVRFSSKK